MHKIRILLVDDHTLMRTGVRMVLQAEPDMEVVGEAANGDDGVRMAVDLRPDVVLMDLSMPGIGGLEATKRISAAGTGARVLVLTVHAEEEYLMPVLEAGGSGYVTKHSADRELVDAIRIVARGDIFLYPSAATVLTRSLRAPRSHAADDPLHLLSPREREVLSLTAEGYSSTEIGDRLHLSHKTVETYRQRLMDKLDLHHRSELVRFALARGLLQVAPAA
ncbi:MAG TPA: response regulator transcription factor [Longimicrobium sp.]